MLSFLPSRCKNPTLIKSSSCLWIICLCLSTSLTRKGSFWKFSPFPGHQRWTELWLLHRLTIIHMLAVGRTLSFSLCLFLPLSFTLFPPPTPNFQFIALQVYSYICAPLALPFFVSYLFSYSPKLKPSRTMKVSHLASRALLNNYCCSPYSLSLL